MAKAVRKFTEAQLLERLKARSEFAHGYFMTQVTIQDRRADAVWLDGFKMTLTGFEVKCSRADLLNELKDPWKSHAVAQFCQQWYLVVPTRAFVTPKELPKDWGLMVAQGQSTKIIKPAPFNPNPEPWTKELFVRLIRKLKPMHEKTELEAEFSRGRAAGFTAGRKSAEQDNGDSMHKIALARLKEKHRQFKEITGVEIDEWSMKDVASDLAVLQAIGRKRLKEDAARAARRFENAAKALRDIYPIEEPLTSEINGGGMPDALREIARQLVRFDGPIRKAATTIDGLAALVDAPVPTVGEKHLHTAWRVVEPVARLLGQDITIGLVRRIARALEENEDGGQDSCGRGRVALKQLPG